MLKDLSLKKLIQNTYVHSIVLIIASVFTFFPTLDMFFYLDEWGNMYDFTHKPYVYTGFTTNNIYMLYSLFGTDPTGYFGVGVVIFTISVILFYILTISLLKNNVLGLIAGLLYATTPVGTTTATMVWTFVAEGGYPLTVGLLILLIFLLRFFKERKFYYFLIVLFSFLLFLDLEPRRVFIYLPILILFDYIVNFKKLIPTSGFLLRAAALFVGFIAYYKYDITIAKIISTGKVVINEAASTYDGLAKLRLGFESLGHIKPHVTMANMLLGGPWVFISEKITEYVNPYDVSQIYLLVIITIAAALLLTYFAFKLKKELGLLMVFSLGWMYINIYSIYIFSSPGISDTTHRTLSLAAPAYALFYTISGFVIYTFLKKKKGQLSKNINLISIVVLILFIGMNSLATRHSFEILNEFRNRPAKIFFKDLKNFYPTLPKDSLLYFKTPSNTQIIYRLSRIYGGSPYGGASAVTVFYPELQKEELIVTREISDVEKFVASDSANLNKVYAFYFDDKGLEDITPKFRSEFEKEDSL